MNAKLYYTPPTQELFDDMKKAAIAVWGSYDDQYGYATGKINRIKDIENVSDNFMYMLAMFDPINQRRVGELVTDETRAALRERLIDGGTEEWAIPFN